MTTRQIATVAVLASLGGVLSSYIGYLGVALNKLVGTPFGAGQFMAGLHVFWIVLALVMTNRVGVGTATGLLKGTVELLAGSSKGVLVLVLGLAAGALVDLVWSLSPRRGPVTTALAGGVGTSSNVMVFLLFTSTYDGLAWLFVLLFAIAFVSGVIFAGGLVMNVARTLEHAGLLVVGAEADASARPPAGARWARSWRSYSAASVTVVAAVLFFGGAAAYFITVGENLEDLEEGRIKVEGLVHEPYAFHLEDFAGEEVTVEAQLDGDFTHEPMREYTGVPLRAVLERAGVRDGARAVHVIGVDEYGSQLGFDLDEVMGEDTADGYVLVEEHGDLKGGGTGDYYRLVCKDLEGGWWVRWVVRIAVE